MTSRTMTLRNLASKHLKKKTPLQHHNKFTHFYATTGFIDSRFFINSVLNNKVFIAKLLFPSVFIILFHRGDFCYKTARKSELKEVFFTSV